MALPNQLKQGRRFVLWRLENGRKIPYQVNGQKAKPNDPTTWSTFEECKSIGKEQDYNGIGIMLNRDSPLLCIDVDKCLPLENNELDDLLSSFNSYTEISQSSTGLHIFLKAPLGYDLKRNRGYYNGQEIEIYNNSRFIALTGREFREFKEINEINTTQLDDLQALIFPKDEEVYKQNNTITGYKDVNKVIDRIIHAKNGNKFIKVFNGDTSYYDHDNSRARMGLITMALFYTRDRSVLLEILNASKLDKSKENQKRVGVPFFEWDIERIIKNYTGKVFEDMNIRTIKIIRMLIDLLVNQDKKLNDNERDELIQYCIKLWEKGVEDYGLNNDLNIDLDDLYTLNLSRVSTPLNYDEMDTLIKGDN